MQAPHGAGRRNVEHADGFIVFSFGFHLLKVIVGARRVVFARSAAIERRDQKAFAIFHREAIPCQ